MPTTPCQPEQEIRFSVVLYGGVSLAIYMNGIAQELLRMVRGSADLPKGEILTSTETVYRSLAAAIGRRDPPDSTKNESDPIRTRFMIDIISGTSAGGINGVALAKALALKCRNLDELKQVWIDKADIDTLLNDSKSQPRRYPPHPEGRTTSLLNSERMYGLILQTLSAMNEGGKATPDAAPFADQLDLFVTATDLEGLSAPIQLTGHKIDERIHKTVFHFEYAAPANPKAPPETNEFTADYDPMLAFAARCTSSFPVAFEPMRFERIGCQLEKHRSGMTLERAAADYGKFFPAYLAQGTPFQNRAFADGGYLDNRPFSHAIGLIPYRSSDRPAKRKLLFVDPFPEIHDLLSATAVREIDFLENATLAAKTLPRYEVIREDIRTITAMNRRLDRLYTLRKRFSHDRETLQFALKESPDNFRSSDLKEMVEQHCYGECYTLYHHLRVYNTSDFLACIATRLAGSEVDSDEYSYLRLLVRAWRSAHYGAYRQDGKPKTENAFLDRFDADYRLRRLNHLRSRLDEKLNDEVAEDIANWLYTIRATVEAQLRRLRDVTRKLASRTRSPLLKQDSVTALRTRLEVYYSAVMSRTDQEARFKAADDIYKKPEIGPHIDKVMDEISTLLASEFESNRREMAALLDNPHFPQALEPICHSWRCFFWHDVLSLPFLDGTDVQEHSEVQTFRISPADSGLIKAPDKLAGVTLGAFGGFLEQEWREHDIMWGRLDGAEGIVNALLPEPENETLRKHYIDKAQDIILVEEFTASGPGGGTRVFAWLAHKLRERNVTDRSAKELIEYGDKLLDEFPMVKNLVVANDYRTFLTKFYDKPSGPPPEKVAHCSARSLKILGRMIDDLPEFSGTTLRDRLARMCRSGGIMLAGLMHLAMPGSIGRTLAEHWLTLIALAGFLLVLAGMGGRNEGVILVGIAVVLACLGLWVVLRSFGRWLRGREPFRKPLLAVAAVVTMVLVVLGVVKLWDLILAWTGLTGASY